MSPASETKQRAARPAAAATRALDLVRSEAWRRRVFDRLSAYGAILLGLMLVFTAGEARFGASPVRDSILVGVPFAMLLVAAWRQGPYRLRVATFLGCLLSMEFLGVIGYGYVAGTILVALLAVGLAGLLLGRRWAIGAWAASTAVLVVASLLVHLGWMETTFDPALVDPRNLRVGLRVTLSYGVFSGMLGAGVFLVVDRLTTSLAETRQALGEATSARTERARAETEKTAVEAQFQSLVEHAPDSIAIVDRDHLVTFTNHRAFDPDNGLIPNPVGRPVEELVAPHHAERAHAAIERVFRDGEVVSYEAQVEIPDRGLVWYAARVGPVVEDGRIDRVILVANDMSERLDLEEQLLQAQKLEAVGQLTGGVAHDFNNLLTVILGNLQLVASGLPPGDPSLGFVDSARSAARRGAALTHRLLAFARKQSLQPRVLELGGLVERMDDLLRRTLGEAIEVELRLAERLWKCEVDPAQLENVILNLAINARDAMPGGGRLCIETANVDLEEEAARQHDGLEPGPYVTLAIEDNGSGMDRDVLEHVFEPFFTTKGLGRGSGLGLSMVYGFVKQSGGSVEIESEPGRGTCVRLFLPRSMGEAGRDAAAAAEELQELPRGGGELILVVEDDDDVRNLTVTWLEHIGYKTLQAADGAAAMHLVDRAPDIDLLFTDVVLPGGTNGVELARLAQQSRPGLPVLFTSGYTADAHDARLAPGARMIEKPFAQSELAEKVHAALHE